VDCREFDGQVVRLERLKDIADEFIRVRLTRLENLDLNLFEFDYDLTMMVFFMNAEEQVYGRYGGRDARDADNRQSLGGLRWTMSSVLAMHARPEPLFAPKSQADPKYLRDRAPVKGGGRCMHCHQVKEALDNDLRRASTVNRERLYRYPLPENLGLTLDVDQGAVVKQVKAGSPAAGAGLQAGDKLQRLGNVPIHSFGDAQFALDRSPARGALEAAWLRGDQSILKAITLPEGWRKTEIGWRPSLRRVLPSVRLYGPDLTASEKKALGLAATQLAFRQRDVVPEQARNAGIRGGDVILGVDGKQLETDVIGFCSYVRGNYLIGDRITINLLRDGKRLACVMTLGK
jgi:hypothetical protein